MFESAISTFIAPAGVGIFILLIEYFGIRHAAMPSVNIHTIFRVFMPILIVLIGIALGFFIYQMNENRKLAYEIRQLIREDRQAEISLYTAEVK